jgi:erythromycin esterase
MAPGRYATLDAPDRDAATAALTRLLLRMDALVPGPDRHAHLVARHHALGALRLDEHLRELLVFGAPDPPSTVPSSRDVYQAETVRLLRELHGPNSRIVLLMHNAHAQRVPMQLVPGVRTPSAGCHLAAELGDDYLAVGVTARTGTTTEARPNEREPHGIEVAARPLDPPTPDSVEKAVDDTAPEAGASLLDLRSARGASGPGAIRHAHTEMPVDVVAAFDVLVCLPTMTAGPPPRHSPGSGRQP